VLQIVDKGVFKKAGRSEQSFQDGYAHWIAKKNTDLTYLRALTGKKL